MNGWGFWAEILWLFLKFIPLTENKKKILKKIFVSMVTAGSRPGVKQFFLTFLLLGTVDILFTYNHCVWPKTNRKCCGIKFCSLATVVNALATAENIAIYLYFFILRSFFAFSCYFFLSSHSLLQVEKKENTCGHSFTFSNKCFDTFSLLIFSE